MPTQATRHRPETSTDTATTNPTEEPARTGSTNRRVQTDTTTDGPTTDAASARAPMTFDPFCTHRLPNTTDEGNRAVPDPDDT